MLIERRRNPILRQTAHAAHKEKSMKSMTLASIRVCIAGATLLNPFHAAAQSPSPHRPPHIHTGLSIWERWAAPKAAVASRIAAT